MTEQSLPSMRSGVNLALLVIAGALALLAYALVQNQAAAVILGIGVVISAVALVVVSQEKLLYATFVVTFLVAGTAHYYLNTLALYWLCYALAAGIALRFFCLNLLAGRFTRPERIAPLVMLVLFQLFVIGSTFAGEPSTVQVLLGLKLYLPVWLIAGVLALSPVTETFVATLEKGALAVAAVQTPFVIQQHFASEGPDAVVGTFGSYCNATLMLACILAILLAIQLYQTGQMRGRIAAAHIGLSFVLLLAGEVKAVIFLLPLALAVQQVPLLRRAPRKFVKAVPVVLAALGLIFFVYNKLYWSSEEVAGQSLQEKSIGETFDWTWVNPDTGDMGRVTALAVWVIDRRTDPVHRLFGYGAGATRLQSSVAPGIIGARFAPAAVDATSASQLLWETGLVGLLLHMSILAAAFAATLGLARRAADDRVKARMMTIAAMLAVMFAFQFYKNYETTRPQEQLILATMIGLVCAARRDAHFAPRPV